MMIERFALDGSDRAALAGSRIIGAPDPADHAEVTLVLRRRSPLDTSATAVPMEHHAFALAHGASQDDIRAIDGFARRFHLTVGRSDPGRRTVALTGTIGSLAEAFGTTLKLYQSDRGVFRGRTGELYLPAELDGIVVGVFGLDDRPQARPRFRRSPHVFAMRATHPFTPAEVAALYGAPPGTGRNQTIALIELGGGYRTSDLRTYFDAIGVPMPEVTAVGVSGGRNAPLGDPGSADGEVLLDIEVAGAVAPDAHIVVYFAPNTEKGFLEAIAAALHDTVRRPSAVSISWGAPETAWTKQALRAYDEVFQDAAALGVTVCCASGDNGSSDGVDDGRAHVDFPASSPHVLACGGTRLEGSGGRISRESAWNDGSSGGATGGGVSEFFPLPEYQAHAQVPPSVNTPHFRGRGVPDVAGNADPVTGYEIRVDGHDVVLGGTSAVAPLWAALIARRNEVAGRPLGYANPVLYSSDARDAVRDVTTGANGAYRAAAGWDPCTGLGSPQSGGFWRQPNVTG